MAQVSGQITGKYFLGGEKITAGQTLFTIDQRTYNDDYGPDFLSMRLYCSYKTCMKLTSAAVNT